MTSIRIPIQYPSNDPPVLNKKKYVYDLSFLNLPRDILIDLFDKNNRNDVIKLIFGIDASNNYYNYHGAFGYLIEYCIHNNDMEFMKYLVENSDKYYLERSVILKIMDSNNSDIYDIFLNNENRIDIQSFFYTAIVNNNITYLNLLYDYGHQLSNLYGVVFSGHSEIIQYFQSMGHDIQSIIDSFDFTDFEDDINVNIFKALIDANIDISNRINDILYLGVECINFDLVKFCINYGATDFSESVNISCSYNLPNILELLLQSGANIGCIKEESLPNINYNIVQILLKHEYNFSPDILKIIFAEQFDKETDINKITHLFNLVGNFDYLFEKEQFTTYNPNTRIFTKSGDLIRIVNSASVLEYIVSKNKLDWVKLIVQHALDKFQLELNRLFIIAVSNGHIEMTLYLLDLGADIYFANNLALDCVIFFGHYSMLKLLLERGHVLENSINNLFMMGAYGSSVKEYQIIGYEKLINNLDIFRNDYYNMGSDYLTIFKFLIQNNIQIPDYSFYEILHTKYYHIDIFNYYMPNDVNIKLNIVSKSAPFSSKYLLDRSIYSKIIPLIKLLLENGANVTKKSIRMATMLNKSDIVELLDKYTKKIEI